MTVIKSPVDPKTGFSIKNIILVEEATALHGCNCSPTRDEIHTYRDWQKDFDAHAMKGEKSYIKVPTFITDKDTGKLYPRMASLFCECQVHPNDGCDCKEK